MTGQVTVDILGRLTDGPQVVVDYNADFDESTPTDKLRALMISIDAMLQNAVQMRQALGLPVPAIELAYLEAATYRPLIFQGGPNLDDHGAQGPMGL